MYTHICTHIYIYIYICIHTCVYIRKLQNHPHPHISFWSKENHPIYSGRKQNVQAHFWKLRERHVTTRNLQSDVSVQSLWVANCLPPCVMAFVTDMFIFTRCFCTQLRYVTATPPLGPSCTPKAVLVEIPRCTGTGKSSLLQIKNPVYSRSKIRFTPDQNPVYSGVVFHNVSQQMRPHPVYSGNFRVYSGEKSGLLRDNFGFTPGNFGADLGWEGHGLS